MDLLNLDLDQEQIEKSYHIHLDLIIRMYVQKFYSLATFMFYTTIQDWKTNKYQYGVDF
jgi:hypothetical protein